VHAQHHHGRWSLSGPAFEGLLACLHEDREQAGVEYELLRRKLLMYFQQRGARGPEELCDEAFDRVARRLAEGEPVRDVGRYAYGVAQNLLREQMRSPPAPAPPPATPPEDVAEGERLDACLRQCLNSLSPSNRELVIRYYQDDGRTRIQRRERLAREQGLSPNGLRIRIYRLRVDLEGCLERCLAKG
jgi:RNA polymerase sigma factor (sigma-70 family)